MRTIIQVAIFSFVISLVAEFALADELFIYPTKGQSNEQMEKDKYDCYQWEKKESAFDPMAPPTATEPPPQQSAPKGGLVRGAARGAAIGGIADGSDGAKTGAAVGAAVGGMRRRSYKQQEAYKREQWEQEQAANYQNNRNLYNRAYGACLEGKGYTVK